MKRLIAGNWKMNGTRGSLRELDDLSARLTDDDLRRSDVWLFPPATLLAPLAERRLPHLAFGGQDCYPEAGGAVTGEISAEMLADLGATTVLAGHSERRHLFGETSDLVRRKAEAAHRAGLVPIVCVGETQDDREAGKAVEVVFRMAQQSWPTTSGAAVLAYEPVWAIGSGLTPTAEDMANVHGVLREFVGADVPILYGGSVKGENAGRIMDVPHVNGVLVGGASLTADAFHAIISA